MKFENGKYYIGQSIDIDRRWYDHKYKAFNKNDISYNSAIHSAMRKYGLENFTLSVIEECQEEDLDKKERYWINQLNSLVPNGYNILEGGQSNRSYATFCKNVENKFQNVLNIVLIVKLFTKEK